MGKIKIRFVDIIYWLTIIGADIFVYIVLSVLQMDYDDNYDSSKGKYWSLASMNTKQLIFYFTLQFWNIINIIGLIFIGKKIYKRIKYGTQHAVWQNGVFGIFLVGKVLKQISEFFRNLMLKNRHFAKLAEH